MTDGARAALAFAAALLALPAMAQQALPIDARWYAVNDGVMGGRSESAPAVAAAGTLVFAGAVSLENNGGFASIRRTLDTPADGIAFVVTLRTDGKRYRMTAYTEVDSRGLQYSMPVDAPAGEWTRVRLPAAGFHASFRGRALPDAPPLTIAAVRAAGFIISDRQEGPFRLEIRSIEIE